MANDSQKNMGNAGEKPSAATPKGAPPPKNDAITNRKIEEMQPDMVDGKGKMMTTDHGIPVNDDHNSLKAGRRGPTLIQDFVFKEKMQHFDRERIPERVVHARGAGAHGVFKLNKSLAEYTRAKIFTEVGAETPVFVRFSTVAGFRGSTDLARDARGFAVKFYTPEGNYDLVGNNIPVFFIQDAHKFPDLVHAVKPEADNEIPQATAAHDTFWDFISLSPESTHMIMWAMSDRAIPRSYRMMEGFGVHTFRFINEAGKSTFVKFHWKPVLGVHSVAWDEAQKISGKDPDFHRRDLWDNIEDGHYPAWDLGVQLVAEEDEHKFDFDLLDATKLIPEELVPVEIVGRMTLNRNPDNYFAETEQVAFNPDNVVAGIDFSNDPLLQGRLLSYADTHIHRLGSQNFGHIPINRPLHTAHNNHRDGFMQTTIPKGKANYSPSSIGGGCPFQAGAAQGGYVSYREPLDGEKIRARGNKFFEHFSQAKLFYNSQAEHEQQHIKDALSFELSKVARKNIQQRMVDVLTNVDLEIAQYVAKKLGLPQPTEVVKVENHQVPADGNPEDYASRTGEPSVAKSKALSMADTVKDKIEGRCIAALAADGVDAQLLRTLKEKADAGGAVVKVIAPRLGTIRASDGSEVTVDETFFNTASVLHDAVFVPGGSESIGALADEPDVIHFVAEQFRHCKPLGRTADAEAIFRKAGVEKDDFVTQDGDIDVFLKNLAQHRLWSREKARKVPA